MSGGHPPCPPGDRRHGCEPGRSGRRFLQDRAGTRPLAGNDQGQRLRRRLRGTSGDVLALFRHHQDNHRFRLHGFAVLLAYLQAQLAAAGRQRFLRHEHPFAVLIGGDLAEGLVFFENGDGAARFGPSRHDGLPLRGDAHHVEPEGVRRVFFRLARSGGRRAPGVPSCRLFGRGGDLRRLLLPKNVVQPDGENDDTDANGD